MYDILQLNDMLVPELHDIAEQLKIPNTKKLDKQALVYKILDSQAIAGSKNSGASHTDEKGKRKRIIKTSTGLTNEEAVVESNNSPVDDEKKSIKKLNMAVKKEEKVSHVKRPRKKPEEKEVIDAAPEQSETMEEESTDADINDNAKGEDATETENTPEQNAAQNKVYPARRDRRRRLRASLPWGLDVHFVC